MRLVRNEVTSANAHLRGYKAHFTIECSVDNEKDMATLEAVEDALRAIETGVMGDGKITTWEDVCDTCPVYDEGYSSGFWVELADIEQFKADYKTAKKSVK